MAEVTYRIRRFDPEKDAAPHWEDYRIEATPGMTVLDGLLKIKETQSPTLAWRSSYFGSSWSRQWRARQGQQQPAARRQQICMPGLLQKGSCCL